MAVSIEESITIYKLVKVDHLQKTIPNGYYTETLERETLEVVERKLTKAEVGQWLDKNANKHKGFDLVLLPVLSVSYDFENS